jgi:TonB family protein
MMRPGVDHKLKAAWVIAAAMLISACAPQGRVALPPPAAPPAASPAAPPVAAPAPRPQAPGDVEAYKALVASEIWLRNAEVYSDPVPDMLKSIVVLEITIDRAGNPIDVSVYRSNGFKHLETRALESIVRAAPFPAPAAGVLEGPGCVTFLETFLFRADERFQLRSLVMPALAAR